MARAKKVKVLAIQRETTSKEASNMVSFVIDRERGTRRPYIASLTIFHDGKKKNTPLTWMENGATALLLLSLSLDTLSLLSFLDKNVSPAPHIVVVVEYFLVL